MNYKGYKILPVYSVCADWKLDRHGSIVARKPTKKDIEYYEIWDDEYSLTRRWIAEDSIAECKKTIDEFLVKLNEVTA